MRSPQLSFTGRVFSVIALIEALTWAGLLVGMYLKYVSGTTDTGVWLFGRLHGAVFVTYVIACLVCSVKLRWPWWATILAFLAAIPPLVTLPLEIFFKSRGLLSRGAVDPV